MEPVFLTLDEVLEIHQQQIERYGGTQGLRDSGALQSAIAMPAATFEGRYLHLSIPAMAAAYLFHIGQFFTTRKLAQTADSTPECHSERSEESALP